MFITLLLCYPPPPFPLIGDDDLTCDGGDDVQRTGGFGSGEGEEDCSVTSATHFGGKCSPDDGSLASVSSGFLRQAGGGAWDGASAGYMQTGSGMMYHANNRRNFLIYISHL